MPLILKAQTEIKLWEDAAPTSNGLDLPELLSEDGSWLVNVSEASIFVYLPKKELATGAAVIICPGGGYAGLAIKHEGEQFAEWLNERGIAAFVLKYRMPNKHKEVPLNDLQQAISYVRGHAQEYALDVSKIGVAGFSAGGHLAATASTHFAGHKENVRPDFSILFYPVITVEGKTHGGSRTNLLGDNPSQEDLDFYSNEKQVTKDTPPTILLLSDDDNSVSPSNSTMYYDALKKYNIPATMYVFPGGGHGWGMNKNFKYHLEMLSLLDMWFQHIQAK